MTPAGRLCSRGVLSLLLGVLLFSFPPTPPVLAEKPIVLGVVPHHSLLQMEAFYAPLAAYLGEQLGRAVRFGTSSNLRRFRTRIRRGDFDLIFLGPDDYAAAAYQAGYRPLVCLKDPTTAVFVVTPTSSVHSLADLRGLVLAVPPPEFAAARLATALLRRNGIEPGREVELSEQPQHNACIRQMLSGRAAACATVGEALQFLGLRDGEDYRVIARSEAVLPPLFVAGPSLPASDRERLARALIEWPARAPAAGGPADVGWLQLKPATEEEYRPLLEAAAAAEPPESGRP